MPIHNWTRVPAGLFHHFHQDWSIEIARELNRGRLPAGYYALVEQHVDGPEPDVIAVEGPLANWKSPTGPIATLDPPRTKVVARITTEAERYASKANRICVHHPMGDVVAMIEIVSPGNKSSRHGIRSFVEKAAAYLRAGVHLLIVDLFPPSVRDPGGIHPVIFAEFTDQSPTPSPDQPLTLVSYQASTDIIAHIEPVAVGDSLPDMPLFLNAEAHIPVPLEATYQTAFGTCPKPLRDLVS